MNILKRYLRNAFGLTYVTEYNDKIMIGGINTKKLILDIKEIWGNVRAISLIFDEISWSSVVFEKFFAVDILYILQQITELKRRRSNLFRTKSALDGMRKHTWLKTLDMDHPDILDFTRLNRMFHKPFPHQWEALRAYNSSVPKMKLKGYLLGASPGAGKTIISLAVATSLDAKVIIAVVPKSLANTVWVGDIKTEFGEDTRVWSSAHNKPLTFNYKYYVFHYEALEKARELAKHISKKTSVIILDESHNFNEIKSQRTQNFINLCKESNCQHIIFASGTPIKAIGAEMIPLLKCIDGFFTDKAEEQFKKIYGMSAKRAVDILRHRLDLISYKIPATVFMKTEPPIVEEVLIKIPNGEKYSVENVQQEMRKYMEDRLAYFKKNMKKYEDDYEMCLAIYEKTIKTSEEKREFATYKRYVELIKYQYDPVELKQELAYANKFEKTKVRPILNPQQKVIFNTSKTVYKYVNLLVVGEALGKVLTKRRSECCCEMVRHSNINEIMEDADKKTIVFTSFVDALRAADEVVRKGGFVPTLVYGETNKNVSSIMAEFKQDETINPMIATIKSLSTGQTLIVANTIIFLDIPFRPHEIEQAVARAHRIGQTAQVRVYKFILDTGSVPNISNRAHDIMNRWKDQVAEIMGEAISDDTFEGIVKRLDMNPLNSVEKAVRMFKNVFR